MATGVFRHGQAGVKIAGINAEADGMIFQNLVFLDLFLLVPLFTDCMMGFITMTFKPPL